MKRICVLLLSVLVLTAVKAQEFHAGLTLGAAVSQVDGDKMSGFHKIGLQGGVFITQQLSKHSAWQGEILFVNKGSGIESNPNPDFRVEISSYYIDFGLYYKYLYNQNVNFKIGLVPSVFISSKESVAGIEQPEIAPYRKFNLLFSAGLEYYFNDHWFVSADFNYSIISFRKGKAIISDYNSVFFHFIFENGQYYNYLKFSLGYKF
ncbi:MAG: PorT family protein [Bacteroidales bacterium]|nr:PorT family protein [Bacteroidales bacterium]